MKVIFLSTVFLFISLNEGAFCACPEDFERLFSKLSRLTVDEFIESFVRHGNDAQSGDALLDRMRAKSEKAYEEKLWQISEEWGVPIEEVRARVQRAKEKLLASQSAPKPAQQFSLTRVDREVGDLVLFEVSQHPTSSVHEDYEKRIAKIAEKEGLSIEEVRALVKRTKEKLLASQSAPKPAQQFSLTPVDREVGDLIRFEISQHPTSSVHEDYEKRIAKIAEKEGLSIKEVRALVQSAKEKLLASLSAPKLAQQSSLTRVDREVGDLIRFEVSQRPTSSVDEDYEKRIAKIAEKEGLSIEEIRALVQSAKEKLLARPTDSQ